MKIYKKTKKALRLIFLPKHAGFDLSGMKCPECNNQGLKQKGELFEKCSRCNGLKII